MKTTWFDIEQDVVNKSHSQNMRGVKVNVKLSPFDVPICAKSTFDETHGILKIEFQYDEGSESLKEVSGNTQGISFYVGKKSGRLFGININPAEHLSRSEEFTCELQVQLEQIVHDLPEIKKDLRKQSSTAIVNVINHYKDQLTGKRPEYCIG